MSTDNNKGIKAGEQLYVITNYTPDLRSDSERLNDLVELIKSQYKAGSISLETYEAALRILSS